MAMCQGMCTPNWKKFPQKTMILPSWSRGNQGPANEKALITLVMLCLMSEAQQMRLLVETVQCRAEKNSAKKCAHKNCTQMSAFLMQLKVCTPSYKQSFFLLIYGPHTRAINQWKKPRSVTYSLKWESKVSKVFSVYQAHGKGNWLKSNFDQTF